MKNFSSLGWFNVCESPRMPHTKTKRRSFIFAFFSHSCHKPWVFFFLSFDNQRESTLSFVSYFSFHCVGVLREREENYAILEYIVANNSTHMVVVVVCVYSSVEEQIFAQKEGEHTINMIIYIFIVLESPIIRERSSVERHLSKRENGEKHNLSAEMSIACQCWKVCNECSCERWRGRRKVNISRGEVHVLMQKVKQKLSLFRNFVSVSPFIHRYLFSFPDIMLGRIERGSPLKQDLFVPFWLLSVLLPWHWSARIVSAKLNFSPLSSLPLLPYFPSFFRSSIFLASCYVVSFL